MKFHIGAIRLGDRVCKRGEEGMFIWAQFGQLIECRSYTRCHSEGDKFQKIYLREDELRAVWLSENIGGRVIIPALREAVGA